MTVPAPGSLTYAYSEDGVTTIFAYPVRFIEAQELVVIRTVGGVTTTLTMGVDYTVSGEGNPAGGSITRTAATNGGTITITRDTTWKQIVDLEDKQRNPAQAVEDQLDRLTMAGQDARAKLGVLLDKTSDIDEAVLRAESARDASEAAKESAEDSAAAALVSGQSAHDDAIATAADRVQTGLDAAATNADRTQTGLDAISTAADRVQTGLDRIATGADRTQTGLDAIATAADRVQTGLDATASGSAASAASDAKDDAEAAKIAAEAAAASLNLPTIGAGDAGKSLVVKQDETGYEFGGGATAEDVTYDPTSSGLTATDVQGAIDELASSSGGDVAADTHAAGGKATPVDADELPLVDSAASWVLKKMTWANLKATLKTYFDGLYLSLTGGTMTGNVTMAASTQLVFWNGVGSKILLNGDGYGFGVESGTLNYWGNTTHRFRGGSAANGAILAEIVGVATQAQHLTRKDYVDGIALGVGQVWQDYTASRATNTAYQNTTGRSIAVSAEGGASANRMMVSPNNGAYITVNGMGASGVGGSGFAVVPAGWYYKFGASGSLSYWAELR